MTVESRRTKVQNPHLESDVRAAAEARTRHNTLPACVVLGDPEQPDFPRGRKPNNKSTVAHTHFSGYEENTLNGTLWEELRKTFQYLPLCLHTSLSHGGKKEDRP